VYLFTLLYEGAAREYVLSHTPCIVFF